MSEQSNRSFCHYCQREFREGEGRYRLLFKKSEVECCPVCFDTPHAAPNPWLEEPEEERTAGQVEK